QWTGKTKDRHRNNKQVIGICHRTLRGQETMARKERGKEYEKTICIINDGDNFGRKYGNDGIGWGRPQYMYTSGQ
ncbi:MAG: hypothetical protein K2K87_05860, partial [Lachnospiraceae bacterium]|nr:hypothetical protein [Lachnospiraceae bacterium]